MIHPNADNSHNWFEWSSNIRTIWIRLLGRKQVGTILYHTFASAGNWTSIKGDQMRWLKQYIIMF